MCFESEKLEERIKIQGQHLSKVFLIDIFLFLISGIFIFIRVSCVSVCLSLDVGDSIKMEITKFWAVF